MNTEFEIQKNSTIEETLSTLKRYGIAVIPEYLNEKDLKDTREEFLSVICSESPKEIQGCNAVVQHPGTIISSLQRLKLDPEKFPAFQRVFGCTYMDELTKRFFEPLPVGVNTTLYLDRDQPAEGAGTLTKWHFDQVHSLKFFFYLQDTTTENGAFEFVPGSHREGFYRSNFYLSQGVKFIPNVLPDEEVVNGRPIEGKAGTLIIFDTDGLHRGGLVTKGERWVLRGHSVYSRPKSILHKLMRGLLRSPLNPAKSFTNQIGRHLGSAVTPQAHPSNYQKPNTKIEHFFRV